MITRTYSELITLPTFEERYRYLKLGGKIGVETFGHDRYLNQILYNSPEWKKFKSKMIIRDNGCDLALEGFEIHGAILLHHINPISVEDVLRRDLRIFDPENVVSTVLNTHNAIHYGDESLLMLAPKQRFANDTCPWRR